jgi:RND family efflux transporter MFP subunit
VCEEQLAYLKLAAPIDGVVTERHLHEGSLVGPGSAAPIVRIQELARLRLVAAVPEAAVGGISAGEKVVFGVSAWPGAAFLGTVARISRALDPKTRTMAVELDVDNASGRLAPGMFAEVDWKMRREAPSLFVPAAAVAMTTERMFVIRIRDGVAEWVDVKLGASSVGLVEVFCDVSAGDVVVARASDEIRHGTKVTVKEGP